jgi:hypothetical protein
MAKQLLFLTFDILPVKKHCHHGKHRLLQDLLPNFEDWFVVKWHKLHVIKIAVDSLWKYSPYYFLNFFDYDFVHTTQEEDTSATHTHTPSEATVTLLFISPQLQCTISSPRHNEVVANPSH